MRHPRAWCGVLSGFLFLSPFGGGPASRGHLEKPELQSMPVNSNLRVDPEFGKMPVYFIPNRGQIDGQVAYYVQGKDKTVYFADEGITFVLTKQKERSEDSIPRSQARMAGDKDERDLLPLHSWDGREGPREDSPRKEEISERWVVKLDFVGANPDAHPEGLDETGTKISYFKGKPEEWKAGLPAYSKVIYKDLWPGIDLVYYGTVNRLKYEFIVKPGGDPSLISLAYRGAESVSIDEAGRLEVMTPYGGFKDDAPVAYQEIGGKRTDVQLAYRLDATLRGEKRSAASVDTEACGIGNEDPRTRACSYAFKIGDYDRSLPLILDPAILIYCGYIGGSGNDGGGDVAVDSAGCAYVTGWTDSTQATFPVTVGPDLTFNGSGGWSYMDAFVAKVNANGTGLVYCGYIGGAGNDDAETIAVDGSFNAYIAGATNSTQATFPVTLGPDLTYNGNIWGGYYYGDAFVAKVNAAGTALDYCGYIGGNIEERAEGIAVDISGSLYVAGWTTSKQTTFPVTTGPDLILNGISDVFVAKVNPHGTALEYCGYVGGNGGEHGYGIAVDASGCAYVTGSTYSTEATFPVTVGPDLSYNGGSLDGFVFKVNAAGTALVYCGYVGRLERGTYTDWLETYNSIAVDSSGCAYVVGGLHCHSESDDGFFDPRVVKIQASGESFVYDFLVTEFPVDGPRLWDVAVDEAGCAYLIGMEYFGFVAKINASGTAFIYSKTIGGTTFAIAVDGPGNAYVTGHTVDLSSLFPVIVGPDMTHNGEADAFVAKIAPECFGFNVFDDHDFNGDGASDISVFRPSNGFWYLRGIGDDPWGQVNDIPVPGDYNGDGITDMAVWRPTNGYWYLRGIDDDKWGQVGDVPVPKDYDGDGRTDLAVWRPSNGTFYIRYRAGGGQTKPWGQTGDFPVPGDYNGDGLTDLAVWRPSNGLWYIKGVDTDLLGQEGDIPVPADYDGDGRTDLAVWRPSDGTWRIRYRAGGGTVKRWGKPGDVPVPGDYNGDGIADLAVWRPSTGAWLIRNIGTVRWGARGDIPLVR